MATVRKVSQPASVTLVVECWALKTMVMGSILSLGGVFVEGITSQGTKLPKLNLKPLTFGSKVKVNNLHVIFRPTDLHAQ